MVLENSLPLGDFNLKIHQIHLGFQDLEGRLDLEQDLKRVKGHLHQDLGLLQVV
jgi:hypothetical protein